MPLTRQSPVPELLALPPPERSTVEPLLLSLPLRGLASTGVCVSWLRGELPPSRGRTVAGGELLLPELELPPEVVLPPEVEPPPRGSVPEPPPRGLTVPLAEPELVELPLVVLPPVVGRSIVPPPPLPPRGDVGLVAAVELVVPPEGSVLPGRELVAVVARSPFPRVVTRFFTSCESAGSLWKN